MKVIVNKSKTSLVFERDGQSFCMMKTWKMWMILDTKE